VESTLNRCRKPIERFFSISAQCIETGQVIEHDRVIRGDLIRPLDLGKGFCDVACLVGAHGTVDESGHLCGRTRIEIYIAGRGLRFYDRIHETVNRIQQSLHIEKGFIVFRFGQIRKSGLEARIIRQGGFTAIAVYQRQHAFKKLFTKSDNEKTIL